MVNSLPCPVKVLPLHPINTPSGHLEDASSPLILTLGSMLSHVPPVKSPSPSWPATNLITSLVSSVMSPLCHMSPNTMSPSLKTTQAMSHEWPVVIPVGSKCPRSAFIEEVYHEDTCVLPSGPEPIGHTTVQHIDDLDLLNN